MGARSGGGGGAGGGGGMSRAELASAMKIAGQQGTVGRLRVEYGKAIGNQQYGKATKIEKKLTAAETKL